MSFSIKENLELYPLLSTVPFLVTAFIIAMLVFIGFCFAVMAGPDTFIFDSSVVYDAERRHLLNWETQPHDYGFSNEA